MADSKLLLGTAVVAAGVGFVVGMKLSKAPSGFGEKVARAEKKVSIISVDEAKVFIQSQKPLIIDVRDSGDVTNGIKGAVNIPLSNLVYAADADFVLPDDVKVKGVVKVPKGTRFLHSVLHDKPKNVPILMSCGLGGQALIGAEILVDYGYTNVKAVGGGNMAWLDGSGETCDCMRMFYPIKATCHLGAKGKPCGSSGNVTQVEASGTPTPSTSSGVLAVKVLRGSKLTNKDSGILGDVSDPFVVGTAGKSKFETPHIPNNLNPDWAQKFGDKPHVLGIGPEPTQSLHLQVMDHNKMKAHAPLGSLTVDISKFEAGKAYPIKEKLKDGGEGMLEVEVTFTPCTGVVTFEQKDDKTCTISYEVKGLAPGKHGFHVHEKADFSNGCDSAGPHFNPFKKQHGGPDDKERHVGDLGNIEPGPDGVAKGQIVDKLIKLEGECSVLHRSVMVHADPDDLGRGDNSQPGPPPVNGKASKATGNAGARIACGEILLA